LGCPAMFLHLVARALPGQTPFSTDGVARWMMRALRRTWPEALSACLMPSHLHLLLACADAEQERKRLARIAAAFSQHSGQQRVWRPVESPRLVTDHAHLIRTIRYVHLNPCRSRLVDDPLMWPYSTHRDVVGAVVDPWVPADRVAAAIRYRGRGFRDWYHQFVSSEARVARALRDRLRPAEPRLVPTVPLQTIVEAVVAATPWSTIHVRRRAVVLLAVHQGWDDPRLLARAANLTPRHVRNLMRESSPEVLAAAAMCLGDARLRYGPHPRDTSLKASSGSRPLAISLTRKS